MKKIYSFVLMAAALLVSTTASATTVAKIGTAEYETFEAAWKAVKTGETIQLQGDITIGTTLWLGTTTMADANPLSITLDLNGDTLTSTAQKVFVLTHGSLTVKNGVIEHAPTGSLMTSDGKEYNSAIEVFRVYGSTYKDVDSKTAAVENLYTHLTIESNARIIAAVNGITVDKFSSWDIASAWAAGNVAIPTTDAAKVALYTDVYASGNGVAHGVCIDVKGYIQARKYAIKSNGNLRTPDYYAGKIGQGAYRPSTQKSTASGATYVVEANDAKNYSPYIHVYSTAKLLTTETKRTDAVAAYSAGYARWLVEGNVEGSTAVYVKSGDIDIKSAIITSNFNGTRPESTTDRSSGVDAGGSGVAIESSANYGGDIDVSVGGSTVITPTKGYALDEILTNQADTSKVNNIEINGGTFKEGDAGTIKVTQETTTGSGKTESTSVVIGGGTFEFADNTSGSNTGVDLGGKTLEQFLTDQAVTSGTTHTVVVDTDDEGHQTIVISDGDAPSEVEGNSVIGAAEDASISWKNSTTKEETLTGSLKLTELQISQDYAQKLIIADGATLEVGRVVLGAKAQIVVKAGGKLIVTGAQGLAAFQESNLILEASESKQAIFLFNPAVTSNTHPMATVEFLSKSYGVDADHWARQCFGIPTHEAMTSIDAVNKDDSSVKVRTKFGKYNYATHAWEVIGEINSSNPAVDLNDMANPFDYYQMINYGPAINSTKVIMKGRLVGNDSPQLSVRGNSWNGYANSCTAPMNINVLLSKIPNSVQKAIYLLDISEAQTTWIPRSNINENEEDMQNVAPLQPFLIENELAAANVDVSYEEVVYNPAMGIQPNQNPAPARRVASDITKVKLIVKGENSTDRVYVAEGEEFSAEFDNGYDAVKYMNDGINMYVSADKKMAIFATDDIENTYVGFQTVKGGTYTIEFANVQGAELTIIDHETGARVAMVEGNVYEFTAAANTVNDYRFEIVESAKLPTAIDNTEVVKSAKGIYTITGQYVGEMNVWNTLPAGVYVINGEKRVK